MRVTVIILLTTCLQVSATGYGQKPVTLNEKSATLGNIPEKINKQTGKDELKPHPGDIKGQVVNENGEPVAGVTIKLKGTDRTTVTDRNGEFSMGKVDPGAILVFTHISMEPVEFKVAGKSAVTIRLKYKISPLDELQVIAYGTTTKRLNTGNVSTVKAADIERQPVSNPLAALEGRVPGLIITSTSGVPGTTFKVQLRGQSSIGITPGALPSTDPLFIIDGMAYAPGNSVVSRLISAANRPDLTVEGGINAFNSINPLDIESIDILKDADATAIYGSRGANGVIIITTKKGKSGKTKITANVYAGASKVTRTMDMLNTEQYLSMRHEAFANDGVTPDQFNAPDLTVWDTTRYTDWKKEIIGNTAQMMDAQLSLSGGSINTQFLFSGDYRRETTVFPGDFPNSRASAHFNLNHSTIDNRMNISFLSSFSSSVNTLPAYDMAALMNLSPNFPALLTETGKLKWEDNGIRYINARINNPYAYLFQKYKSHTDNLLSSVVLNYKILPSLTLRATAGYSLLITDETTLRPNSSLDPQSGALGSSTFANGTVKSWNVEPQIEYVEHIGKGKLTVLAGGTFNDVATKGGVTSGLNYTNDLLIGSLSGASIIFARDDDSKYRYESIFGRVSYNWQNKYLLNITCRRDGSSRFGPDKQFANFASVGAGWIFTNEKIVADALPFLSFGKIRSSYGTTGVEPTLNYQYLDTWQAISYNGTYQDVSSLRPSRLYNPDYNWEITRKLEGTIDLGFWNDRLLLSGTYYRNRSSNQLINYTLPIQTGFSNVFRNFPAVVQNSGFEFSLATKNIMNKSVTWESTVTLTIPRNKLISFPDLALSTYSTYLVEGKSLNTLRGYRYLGVDPTSGVYTYEDVHVNGYPDYPSDWFEHMNRDPKFYGGFSNTIRHKGLQLDIFMEFRKQTGINYLAKAIVFGGPPGFMNNQPTAVLERWEKPGDASTVQKFTQDYNNAYDALFYLTASNGVYSDASFIRFKNICLSYNLANSLLHKLHLENARLYVNSQNLFTITHYLGSDPETQNLYRLPPLKTIVAGIQLTL